MAKKLRSLLGEIDKKFKESEEVRKQSHTLTMTSLQEQHGWSTLQLNASFQMDLNLPIARIIINNTSGQWALFGWWQSLHFEVRGLVP